MSGVRSSRKKISKSRSGKKPLLEEILEYQQELEQYEEDLAQDFQKCNKYQDLLNGMESDVTHLLISYAGGNDISDFGKSSIRAEYDQFNLKDMIAGYEESAVNLFDSQSNWIEMMLKYSKRKRFGEIKGIKLTQEVVDYDTSKSSIFSTYGIDTSMTVTQGTVSFHEMHRAHIGNYVIKSEDLEIFEDQHLGSGAFGSVYKGKCYDATVAVKTLNIDSQSEAAIAALEMECAIMNSLTGERILLFMGLCKEFNSLVMEYATNGSLQNVLDNDLIILSYRRKTIIAHEIAEGLSWLHERHEQILHLDLKPSNILLTDEWHIKISDFGMSQIRAAGESAISLGGTPLYMAPEVIKGDASEKSDVYAYAVVLWTLFTEERPMSDIRGTENITRSVLSGKRPEIPHSKISPELADLIQICWGADPDSRLKMSDILKKEDGRFFERLSLNQEANGSSKLTDMWHAFGPNVESVPFYSFIPRFFSAINVVVPSEKIQLKPCTWVKCMEAVLNTYKNEQNVTRENFMKFIKWFPFTNGQTLMAHIEALLKEDWFFGDISFEESEQYLKQSKKSKVFLIRNSRRSHKGFIISQKNKRR
eukprot:TRINITY_DN1346_c0_g2_i2.p1 TRINITY_DN1346_c0_g2~~TRINITY_DN1346_c0_g2_i2.p1  ORF type:complete len:604 (-),score=108.62 TRINITY_DN1346_c0_g2_i2:332-2104(-)